MAERTPRTALIAALLLVVSSPIVIGLAATMPADHRSVAEGPKLVEIYGEPGPDVPRTLSTDGEHGLGTTSLEAGGGTGVPLPAWVIAASYSRYDDSDPLDNDVRRAIYEAVRDAPGAYPVELAEITDIPRSTIRYHVRILEEEGLVFGEKIRGKHRYFPHEADDTDVALTAALAEDATAAVLDAVARHEPASVSTLADHLDRAASTVSHHLDRLDEDGLVERSREGGAVLTRIALDVNVDERLARELYAKEETGRIAAANGD